MEIAKADLLCKDKLITTERKYNEIFKKYTTLKKQLKNNHHLKSVVEKYERTIEKYKKEKQAQHTALNVLSEYIDNITAKTKLSEQLLHESKHEQSKILTEMSKIERKLAQIPQT
tara:strand:+ start:169 stop:513 length:345 start_codon:yes stop_codon:yes gene_type:complete